MSNHLKQAIFHIKQIKSDNPRVAAMLVLLAELLSVANIEQAQLELDLGDANSILQAKRDIHCGTKKEKLEYDSYFDRGF